MIALTKGALQNVISIPTVQKEDAASCWEDLQLAY